MRLLIAIIALVLAIAACFAQVGAQEEPQAAAKRQDAPNTNAIAPTPPLARQEPPTTSPPAGMIPTSPDSQGPLFAGPDIHRVETLARKHGFVLPPFEMRTPDRGLPEPLRRFVGVWIDEEGYKGKGRRLMLIVTHVATDGRIDGFSVYGPPDSTSFNQAPAGMHRIHSRIESDAFAFLNASRSERMSYTLLPTHSMKYAYANTKGQTTTRTLLPVWRLIAAERERRR